MPGRLLRRSSTHPRPRLVRTRAAAPVRMQMVVQEVRKDCCWQLRPGRPRPPPAPRRRAALQPAAMTFAVSTRALGAK